jgi:hypothetical protein
MKRKVILKFTALILAGAFLLLVVHPQRLPTQHPTGPRSTLTVSRLQHALTPTLTPDRGSTTPKAGNGWV